MYTNEEENAATIKANELATKQKVDQSTPNMGIVGSSGEVDKFGNRLYTDDEEDTTSTNYLKNRAAARGKTFTKVMFWGNKKKDTWVHIT
jgi:hypothetical protein